MKRKWLWVPFFLLLEFPLSNAERIESPMSALHLYTACKEVHTSEYARGFCDGAIDALYGSMEEWCVPQGVTHSEVKEKVMEELLGSVPQTSSDALVFVTIALHRKWPCP